MAAEPVEATEDTAYEQPRRLRRVRWTAAMRDGFLDHLAATCSISASAAAIGVDPSSVYNLRRKSSPFRKAWAHALQCGYEMLETQLVGHALDGGGPLLTNGDVEAVGPIDVKLALALLTRHRGQLEGAYEKGGSKYKVVTPDQTDASILRKLRAMGLHQADPA